jgi:3'(2'), 5'-bisphosphate nucleotidase
MINVETISLEALHSIAVEAGNKILEIYHAHTDFAAITELKGDQSPLTQADKAAHEVIFHKLSSLYPDIPVLSEEGKHTEFAIRKNWDLFWLVDPLDGTKEFLKRNGEFTVNIALIKNNLPVLGVIYAPVWNVLYYGTADQGAFRQIPGQQVIKVQVNHKKNRLIAVGSRSHSDPAEAEILSRYDISGTTSIGSSLKFCLIAEGKADIYYRHGPTMEWDTAAGQAIVQAAGGKVTDTSGKTFTYNKSSLTNSSFLCQGF